MNKIKRFGIFNFLRNGEHFQLHWTLSDFLTTKIADFASLATLFATYKALFEHEDIVFKHNSRMVGTAEIKRADIVRSKAFRSLRMTIKALTLNVDLSEQQLADDLLLIIDNYKEAPRKAYLENTAYINNLVQELRIPANFEKVEALSLEGLVTSLDQSNILFRTLYNNRSEWLDAQKRQGNMRNIRRPLDMAFRDLASAINSLYEANELVEKNATTREKLEVMIDGVNAHIENAIRAIAYRSPGHSSKPDPDPHPEPEPGPVEPFRFTAVSQEFVASGNIMQIMAPDPQAFHNAVKDRAVGGIVNFQTEEDPNRFTVFDFKYTDEIAGGFMLRPTDDQDLLGSFSGPEITVEVIKDGEVISIIDGVQAPDGFA
ncbi:DUF6261 family protein [Parabacteroides sp. OttesenSCG-928-G21]|nr:DUF6261 family protein [Parabacteroides sp. OttesenSCG-928-G21]